jgi:hypothetical protein
MQILTFYDFFLAPIYFFIIVIIATNYKRRQIEKHPEYKYFLQGLVVKIIGGISLVLVYCYYYSGGDTIGYFQSSVVLSKMANKSLPVFFSLLAGNLTPENFSVFDGNTGWPLYYRDPQSFAVVRYTCVFLFLGGKSFLATTILVSTITYTGIWKLFLLFYKKFKVLDKNLAFAILFMPSVFFWGSGILKDSYTICAAGWFLVCVFEIFIHKNRILYHVFALLISSFIMITLKPYIFFAAFAGASILLTHFSIKEVKNKLVKRLFVPVLIIIMFFGSVYGVSYFGSIVGGKYSTVDNMLYKLSEMQSDLSKDYYGGNSFDIGAFDPTFSGILSKAPQAITAGIFRPFIWECKNPIMIVSGIENLIILFLFLYVVILSLMALFKTGFSYMVKTTFDDPLVIFSIIFAISFSFFIGISTANFGALVRYKIPLIPFFMSSLFIIIHKYNREKID